MIFERGALIAGKYEVTEQLGEGGMGVVLAARHRELETRVAIKVVREEYAANEQVVARMLIEARSAAKIRSEHVCKVLDVGRLESGSPFIVMEHLDGQDLGKLVASTNGLPVATAIDYLLQACEALAEAHAAGIVHRDLKPENLFLARRADGSPLIKVLDFGISKNLGGDERLGGLTSPSSAVGSPFYMSPEQMLSARDVDARTDIWALGVILHELLAGRPPFVGETLPAICALVLNEPPPPLRSLRPEVPEAVEAVVLRCLTKKREERYSSVAEVTRALAPFGGLGASTSAERISRVLSTGSKPPPDALASSATVLAPSGLGGHSALSGQRVAPTVAATAPGLAHPTASGVPRTSKTPLFVGAAAVVLVVAGGALWALERARDASSVTNGQLPPANTSIEAPRADPPSTNAMPPPGQATQANLASTSEPEPAAAQARPEEMAEEPKSSVPTPLPRPKKPAPTGTAPSAAPAPPSKPAAPVNPFDPEAFGGRR